MHCWLAYWSEALSRFNVILLLALFIWDKQTPAMNNNNKNQPKNTTTKPEQIHPLLLKEKKKITSAAEHLVMSIQHSIRIRCDDNEVNRTVA